MNYKDLIGVNENFQYSVNLQFDINNINKIKEYIPTVDSCEVLKIYLNSILYGKNRATTLIGPYGKGKSHLLLVLITLLNNYNVSDKKEMLIFIDKIKRVSPELYDMLIEIRNNNIKLMPIIINSNYNDLNQAFLLALSEALERENLQGLIVNTYFDVALKVIEKWELQYKDAINIFKKCLSEYNCDLKQLKNQLKAYSHEGYEIFKSVYSCVVHGQEFSPLVNTDIVKTYKDIAYQISEYGYSGIFIVFDEFSKFLEYVDNDKIMRDLKLLQDFAELSTRTGKTEQIHLSCITHKTINEYIKNFKDEKTNAFKTVEGRFKEIYFNRSMEQNYEIVSYALEKRETFNEYFDNFLNANRNFYNDIKELNCFSKVNDIERMLFKGCFPLNPLTVYSLIYLSEKIAQNERTLFTFLTDDDSNSLKSFIISNDHDSLFTVDKIYDYFYPLFKKEQDEYLKSIWIKTETSLKKTDSIDEQKILKAVAVIYMINDLEILIPDFKTIMLAIGLPAESFNRAINNLVDKSILKVKKITNEIDFATIYNRELTKEIKNIVDSKFSNIDEKQTLNKVVELSYILPRRYNERYKITRFFKNIFITENELSDLNSFDILFNNNYCDGIVLNLIRVSRNIQEPIRNFIEINDERVVLKVPRQNISKMMINLLKEYEAINYIKHTNTISEEMMNELNLMEIELVEAINDNVEEYFSNDNIQEYRYQNETHKRIQNISGFISDKCEITYPRTPIINNEMINKNELSAPIKKARNTVIDTILTDDLSLIKSETSAEATIRKSIVDKRDSESISFSINIIKRFIESCDNDRKSFSSLFEILESRPYSIRKGVLPILIAIALYEYSDNIILYYMNREIDLDSVNLVKISENPEKYYILAERGTTDKVKYISGLMNIYGVENVDNMRVNLKRLVDSMKKWILSLPRILRELGVDHNVLEINHQYLKIKSELLRPDMNNNEFIYRTLFEVFNSTDYQFILEQLSNMRIRFDSFIVDYSEFLIDETKSIINNDFKGSLSLLLRDWYKNLDDNLKNRIYNQKAKQFFDYISNITTHNDLEIVENVAKIMVGLYIEDWQPLELENYIFGLKTILSDINKEDTNKGNAKKILIVNGDDVIEKYINIENKNSSLEKTMKNNIEDLIDEYGESLSESEKVNVLLDILKKYV